MALIGKIREKSWLLVAVIGIAMLAFIMGDLDSVFNSSGREDQFGIGTVNGEKIQEEEYNNVLQNARNQIFQNKMQQNEGQAVPLDENDERNARQQAWNAIVGESLIKKELAKVGIIVDDVELDNILYGEDDFTPSPAISQAQIFIDSLTGEFNPTLVRQYFESLEMSPEPDAIEQLQGTMDYVRQYRKEQKYNTLLSVGLHATSVEGKEEYLAQKEVKNVAYTYSRFTNAPQDEVGEPTEDELQAFYDKNKDLKKYEQKASKKISYFALEAKPNSEDTLRTKKLLEKLIPNFKKAKSDSNFVMRYSETKEFNPAENSVVPPSISKEVENSQIGDVIGPYINPPYMSISKIIDFSEKPVATVRHILLNANTDDEVKKAQKKADSIVRVIRAKNNFEEMVVQFSEDPGSKDKGGKYEDFEEGMMVPTFNDFSFEKPIGSLGTVKTDYGIHIIEVLERRSSKQPALATINKSIEITKSSMDNINSMASSFIYDIDDLVQGKTLEEKVTTFEEFAKENGYNVRSVNIQDKSPSVQGFSQTAEGRLLRLAYEEGVNAGDISSSPIRDNNRVIIAMLSEVKEAGVPTFDQMKSKIVAEVKKEKQAQYLIEQMIGSDDLGELSQEISGQYETEGITFSATSVAVGKEPILIGTAFSGLLDGQLSIPVKGTNGVFVLLIENTVEAPETMDFSTEKAQLASQASSTFLQRYRTALTDGADVVDNRKLRAFGIR